MGLLKRIIPKSGLGRLLYDLGIYGTFRAIGRFLWTITTAWSDHEYTDRLAFEELRVNLPDYGLDHEELDGEQVWPPVDRLSALNFNRSRAAKLTRKEEWSNKDYKNLRAWIRSEREEIGQLRRHGWEAHLIPWVRRLEELVFLYLDWRGHWLMHEEGLVEELDERCLRTSWPELFVTGSNISAVTAGKAAWALLRYAETGREEFWDKYRRSVSRACDHIDRAFTRAGTPWEGNMYALFGLRAVTALSWVQRELDTQTIIGLFDRLHMFPHYLMGSCVGEEDFHEHGDAKIIDFDGSFLQYLYQARGYQLAGRCLSAIGEANARHEHYSLMYSWETEPEELPEANVWEQDFHRMDLHRGLWIKKTTENPADGKRTLLIAEAGRGLGRHRLHLGIKAGSHSIWHDGTWTEKDHGYTNPISNWRTYRDKWNAPAEAHLTEEAEIETTDHEFILRAEWPWPWSDWTIRFDRRTGSHRHR